MSENPEHDDNPQEKQAEPRGLGVILSLSADRIIAVIVIIVGICLGVWMFRH